jgi:hypothetical protein
MVLGHSPADPASDCASLCSRLHHSSAQSQLDQEDARHAANRPIWTAGCSHDGGDHVSALMADRTPKLPHPPCSRLCHNSAQSQLDQEDARQPANRPMWTAGCAHDGSDHISALIADRTQKMTHPTHPTQKLTQHAFQERFQQRSLSHWTPSHQTNRFHPSNLLNDCLKTKQILSRCSPLHFWLFLGRILCLQSLRSRVSTGSRISRKICYLLHSVLQGPSTSMHLPRLRFSQKPGKFGLTQGAQVATVQRCAAFR